LKRLRLRPIERPPGVRVREDEIVVMLEVRALEVPL